VKLRNPLIALGILAGLSAYVYIVEIKGGRRSGRRRRPASRSCRLKARM
jgi:hypothetical protein